MSIQEPSNRYSVIREKIPGRFYSFGETGANGAAAPSVTIIWIFPGMRRPISF